MCILTRVCQFADLETILKTLRVGDTVTCCSRLFRMRDAATRNDRTAANTYGRQASSIEDQWGQASLYRPCESAGWPSLSTRCDGAVLWTYLNMRFVMRARNQTGPLPSASKVDGEMYAALKNTARMIEELSLKGARPLKNDLCAAVGRTENLCSLPPWFVCCLWYYGFVKSCPPSILLV